ncbi:MAG: T9SS type A sorting domain-containing protein [Flavobacteriales bacterium]|mgnify:CR=1 FL=1|jgi:hypothetical protein|nr:T9SS type A sorting domain-containing protein [Flavobacteriales bacterium]MBT4706186.1 T9SS type A sorting domain-containing protein [Flavobacteriales bacterium]MBT4931371.1 T9SS type A sorting domain-containing protein [Flavobacteriales bacterium]MBT5133195.1 T9SS type A sorting domain-containing protein [Flavobacteriales bacterium]MBT6133787.1 T9SS type A sorting domain-containing protein [Flavobacteriales bacterium]
MNKSLLLLLLSAISVSSFGQTTLPTEWDFATTPSTLPTGWSTNTSASYSSGLPDNSGGTSRAGKLQAQAHHFTIEFYDEPGFVTYNLRAYSSNGSNFMGTFSVEESENGSSWTTLHTFTSNDFGNSWTQITDTPDVDTRHIRFYFTTKVSGVNVGLDDLEIGEFIPTSQEINAVFEGDNVPSGTGIQFSGALSSTEEIKIGIENLGSQGTLMLSTINFTGTAATDYALGSAPTSINPQSADTIVIEFSPSSSGSRPATVSIGNNDSNEDPYLIDLDGIGGGSATEPTTNPSTLSVPMNKTYRIKGSFDNVGADGYLVSVSKNQSSTWAPTDGDEYETGQGVGNGKIVKLGSGTGFFIKEAMANDTFFVKVFAFNGSGAFINYRNDQPLVDSIISPVSMQSSGYYNGVDALQPDFVDDLHDAINPHQVRFYSNYGPDMIPPLVARDTVGGDEAITCVYSGENVVYSPPFGWPETGMNREHTMPASWMPSAGNSGTAEYQDYHHLFPTISTPNSQRSNHPLGNVVNTTNSYGAGKVGTDANGNTVYEPRDAQKGDAVRAIFYMQTAYHDPSSGDSWAFDDLQSNGPNQKTGVLLNWHYEDLPSAFEMARNDYLDSLQQNRNPFVDSAHWVCYINFKTMAYISTPDSGCLAKTEPAITPVDTSDSTIGLNVVEGLNWIHYPNPASDNWTVGNSDGEPFELLILSSRGELIMQRQIEGLESFDVGQLPSGFYLVRMFHENEQYAFPLMIN